MPLISIVMPVYNAQNTILSSIESVLKQTFTDFELLICDDGSTDGTIDIIHTAISTDSRIQFIINDFHRGAAGARNSCIKKARGRFIAFLDSDDLWEPSKLSTQVSYMLSNDLAMTHGSYIMFNDAGFIKEIHAPDSISFLDIIKRCEVGCLTVMLDTTKINDVYFPCSPKEDYALWIKIMKGGLSSYKYPGLHAKYRKQSKSLSSSKLKEISKQWTVLTGMAGLGFFSRLTCIFIYAVYGFIKHYTKWKI